MAAAEIRDLRTGPGELSFKARVGGHEKRVWFRTESEVTPNADAALVTCLMPAMVSGGTLSVPEPVSPKLLERLPDFQAIQRAWSREWEFQDEPLEQVEVRAPTRTSNHEQPTGRVAAFFSGGVDSWSTVLAHPEITDLVFVRGFDLLAGAEHQAGLADRVEERLRSAATELGLPLHVVETNLRELSDPLVRWDGYFGCADAAVALFLAPLFDRILLATDADYEIQEPEGLSRLAIGLLGTEGLELLEDGGRWSRVERTARIADHPAVRQTLRVCWENPGAAYNCGHCGKCLMTLITLEALGGREAIAAFPPQLDLAPLEAVQLEKLISLILWEDVLDATRAARRPDLEGPVEGVVARGRRALGLPQGFRRRRTPGPPSTVRIAVVVPVWRQAQFLAGAVQSALDQEIETGVGVVIVNDGCPDPETDRIAKLLRDAEPDRVVYLSQPNRGLSAARNAGVRRALACWPHVEAVFPLDADNLLSPRTLAALRQTLAENLEAGWASPALEFFGDEEGEWVQARPYLVYRQLFENQSDAGSLVRRAVFEAGVWFDETMREGFEDWEFFLRASLNGFEGALAGRCGFRYRRRPGSMLAKAQGRAEEIVAALRERNGEAYRPAALVGREHAEAPRFALVRCDRGDALVTAACDLEPYVVPLAELLRPRRSSLAGTPLETHVPAIVVLTTAEAIDRFGDARELAEQLPRIQPALRETPVVALEGDAGPVALAMRTRTLVRLLVANAPIEAEASLALPRRLRHRPPPLPDLLLLSGLKRLAQGMPPGGLVIPKDSHSEFFEHRHIDLGQTTLPLSAAGDEETSAAELAA